MAGPIAALPASSNGLALSPPPVLGGPTQLIQYKASKAYEGYTLITGMNADKTYLIDMQEYVMHTWEHKTKPPGRHFVFSTEIDTEDDKSRDQSRKILTG